MATSEDLDKWIELTKTCQYLPENDLKVNVNRCLKQSCVVVKGIKVLFFFVSRYTKCSRDDHKTRRL